MGKKDKKKGKGAEKTANKTDKKLAQKMKKELALKGEEDLEKMVAKFMEEDKKKLAITEDLVKAPSKRSSFSLTAHPDKEQLIMFGGEYFNGSKTLLYNDLFFYHIKQDRWIEVSSPGGPPPRCAHQAIALSQGGGQLWIFGGEFTSETQSQFYHYSDLWVFHFNTKRWEKILGKGTPPTSRSGHRMVALQKHLIVFGGFHDNIKYYRYFNDVYSFSFEHYTWTKLSITGNSPPPRSACMLLPISDGRVLLYGGYSKEKGNKNIDKGVTHTDMFILSKCPHDKKEEKWKWQSVKTGKIRPSTRCAFSSVALQNDRALLFGGVYDVDDVTEEDFEGEFFNDLYMLDLKKQIWHTVNLKGKKDDGAIIDKVKEEEDIPMEIVEEEEKVISDGVFMITIGGAAATKELTKSEPDTVNRAFLPPPRINATLAVKKGIVYMYGGMYEEDEKQLTLNDFYSLDMGKLDEWQTITALNKKDLEWFESDSEDSDEEDDSCDDTGNGDEDIVCDKDSNSE